MGGALRALRAYVRYVRRVRYLSPLSCGEWIDWPSVNIAGEKFEFEVGKVHALGWEGEKFGW